MQYALKEGLIMLRNYMLLCHRFLYMKEENKFTLPFDRDLYMLLLQHRARQHYKKGRCLKILNFLYNKCGIKTMTFQLMALCGKGLSCHHSSGTCEIRLHTASACFPSL